MLKSFISWRRIFAYERALRKFTREKTQSLPSTAFSKIKSAKVGELPQIQYLHLKDDTNLAFRHYKAKSDIHLILIHGAGCFADQFQFLAEKISSSNVAQVYTVDMRGHGLSEGASGHAVEYPNQLTDDIESFVSFVHSQINGGKIILGGHSAGGGLILNISRTSVHDLLSGYVLMAPYLGLNSPTVRPHFGGWVHVRKCLLRALVAVNFLGIKRYNNSSVIDFDVHAQLDDSRYVKSWSFNTMVAFGVDSWGKETFSIGRDKSVILIAGERDECFFPLLYENAVNAIAPQTKKILLDECGHWDLLVDSRTVVALENWIVSI